MRSFISILMALAFFGVATPPAKAEARRPIRVVTTVPDLAAITKAVGGDRVQVVSLSLPTQDAHFVDARPSMALHLNRADLLVSVGRDLEIGWLPTLLTGARNPNVQPGRPGYLEAGQYAEVKGVPTGPIDRSMGDIHPTGNPHFLHDPNQGLRVARAIAERLARIDPEHAETYRQNLETFEADAISRIRRWERMLEPHRGAKVVSYHTSWRYLLDWLGLEEVATIEPKPGIPPSPAHVARLLARMRAEKPALIMQESYYPDATARLLGERADVPVLVLPGGTDFQRSETYLDHIDHVIKELVEALERQPRPVEAHQ